MINIILGEIYNKLHLIFPYALIISAVFLVGLPGYFVGKYYERHTWRRELEAGNRMGAVVREKIGKRDARIKQLTRRIAKDEARLEWAEGQHRELVGLVNEMSVVLMEKHRTLARRRRA